MPVSDDRLVKISQGAISPALPPDPEGVDPELIKWLREALEETWRSIALLRDYLSEPSVEVSSSYTATDEDYIILVDTTSSSVTVTLPPASLSLHKTYYIKRLSGGPNSAIVDGHGSETIDGVTTYPLTAQYEALTLVCDGTEWWIV